MIVADLGSRYQFVTQPDHAALAGQFADHWGGAAARPEPFESLVIAAYHHDVGWEAYDRRPRLDDDGDPVDFRDMPADPWIPLYADGIEAVVDLDPYAGLLVSLHGAGLRNQRYGLSPEWPATPAEFEAFVAGEERRQRELLDALLATDDAGGRASPLSADAESTLAAMQDPDRVPGDAAGRLWHDYRRLQAWDALSLSFCITDTPPGYGTVESVPGADGVSVTLSITRAGGDDESGRGSGTETGPGGAANVANTFTVDPYPFDTAPLSVTVPVRTVEKTAVEGADSLARAYYGAGRETRTVRLRPADR
ncbi:MAG: DUF3891 family protein [Haloarculaceae archaeon]